MAEEQKWQEPGGHRLCANNCGFFGSPTTLNLCSKCYKDHGMKEQHMKEAKSAMEKTMITKQSAELSSSSSSSYSNSPKPSSLSESDVSISHQPPQMVEPSNVNVVVAEDETPRMVAASKPNRCATCKKRVGLTGFKCRCGITFCGSHRYPEQHGCMFDYKALGREEITKANPVVKAEKLDKI